MMYPYTGADVQTTLCVTNKRRKAINEKENRRRAPANAVASVYVGEDLRAQDMLLWAGLEIQAGATDRKHGLKNALRHQIQSVDAHHCTVQREGEVMVVATRDVPKLFRLTHALTIDSSQALTIHGNILIVETDRCFFSPRRLIVAIGRSPSAQCVQTC